MRRKGGEELKSTRRYVR
uniref:Uncharacterized protein n=1 Tax=Rhizophora mucronata TaxID=61149 RepID=A0A2P2NR24_RHIMU